MTHKIPINCCSKYFSLVSTFYTHTQSLHTAVNHGRYAQATWQAGLTLLCGVDHVKNLTDCVLYRETVDVELLQPLEHLLVQVDELKQREHSITINVQHSKPVLYAGEIFIYM